MEKYRLDWGMKVVFWLMRRVPSAVNGDIEKIQKNSDTKLLGNVLYPKRRVKNIEGRSIPTRQGTIPVRIYHPQAAANLPVIVFIHGGGFVLGGLDGYDAICRRLAAENGAVVVSVAYRLAPRHKYPAAVEDSYDATCWVASHLAELGGSEDKLIVMGDSAGGNLAAVVSLLARDLNFPRISYQVLIYPVVDFVEVHPSRMLYNDTPVLPQQAMDFYRDAYIGGKTDLADPQLSPIKAVDFSNLPSALILTAEYDPLRDEGKAYAERLREAGVKVELVCYEGMCHGFLTFGFLGSKTKAAFKQIKESLSTISPAILHGKN